MISNLVCDRGDLKARGRERLADRVVKLAGNLRAFSLLRIDDFRPEFPHPIAADGETVEHLVDGRREMGQLAVGHNGGRDSFGKSTLGDQLRNTLESVDRAKREPDQGKIHDCTDDQSRDDDVNVDQACDLETSWYE